MNRNRLGALLGALFLTLSMTGSAFAAGLSQPVSETFQLSDTYTLVGVPASLTYPAQPVGQTGPIWAPVINIIAFGSSSPGATLTMTATDLTAGPRTIASSKRVIYTSGETNCATTPVHGSPSSIGGNYGAPDSVKTLATLGAAQTTGSLNLGLGINMDGSETSGLYTGTVTISVGA